MTRRRRASRGRRATRAARTRGTSRATGPSRSRAPRARQVARLVAAHSGFDIAYAYKPLHGCALGHAFVNSVLYLDWDREGFDYPMVPDHREQLRPHAHRRTADRMTPSEEAALDAELDPPGAAALALLPARRGVARALPSEPLARRAHRLVKLVPLLPRRQARPHVSRTSRPTGGCTRRWPRATGTCGANTTIEEAEDRGHHELLNWFCLAGAMAELDRRPDYSVFLESWITNSDKVFASFKP